MPNLPDVVLRSLPAFVLLTVLEAVSCRFRPDEDERGYAGKDTAAPRRAVTRTATSVAS
ncbi:hypothetical protein [Kitasatospora sp. DSM 101779]|uniref:hypothetical protein n=1 Tax=Kitasatospora sp. DSM 101779 TaxID=2853165 RepID=UPI0021DB2A91|nr:hypothetical protein [Kitasatospora sp. DSM 101779]MCU7821777.1 hypothetical protein [Kitasatospora sp. DSM 101779]